MFRNFHTYYFLGGCLIILAYYYGVTQELFLEPPNIYYGAFS